MCGNFQVTNWLLDRYIIIYPSKMRAAMHDFSKIWFSLLVLLVLGSCCPEDSHTFRDTQQQTIENLRKSGYHEYHSKLNDVVLAELNSWESDVISTATIEKVSELAEIIKREKNPNGTYVIEWEHAKSQSDKNTITLEWNPKAGVVIRIFTLSEKIKNKLPLQSYS